MNARRQRFLFALGTVCLAAGALTLFLGLRGSDTFYFALAGSFVGFGLAFVVGSLLGDRSTATLASPATAAEAAEKRTT